MDDVALGIGEDLDLDVVGVSHQLFEQEATVAEGGDGFAAGAFDGLGKVFRREHLAHAAPAATPAGLQHHRVADACSLTHKRLGVVVAVPARDDGDIVGDGQLAGGNFVAHTAQDCGWGADEGDAFSGAAFGEVGAFAEEAVAGVDRLATLGLRCGDDGIDIEVALSGRVAFEQHPRVGRAYGQATPVGDRGDDDRADAHLAQGLCDADGDFAAVGDEDAFEHVARIQARVGRRGTLLEDVVTADGDGLVPSAPAPTAGTIHFAVGVEDFDGHRLIGWEPLALHPGRQFPDDELFRRVALETQALHPPIVASSPESRPLDAYGMAPSSFSDAIRSQS
ncbi:hypothetical protein [Candidatus Amarobacter glycogenicus]|uniref:hypothetical protein n=1 Tax=Candidatus Amarobacter glycogenicus TaxID=3140699 RepID=UPI0031CC5C73